MTAVATKGSSGSSGVKFKQGTAAGAKTTWLFHLCLAADGTDATGLVPVVTISKAGAAFGAAGGVVSEIAGGWYKIAFTATDLAVLGLLAIKVAVATADTLQEVAQVQAQDPYLVDPGAISDGTAQAGAASTITLAASESAVDHTLEGAIVRITGGTGPGQIRLVTGYVGSTKVATVSRAWATNPDNTSTYELIPTSPIIVEPVTLKDGSLTAAKFSSDGLAAGRGKVSVKGPNLVATLTSAITSFSRSMRGAIDTTVVLAGTFNGATVRVETTNDETAAAPVWTDQSSGGLGAGGQVVLTGPFSAWRARVSAGAVTSVTVKATDRVAE